MIIVVRAQNKEQQIWDLDKFQSSEGTCTYLGDSILVKSEQIGKVIKNCSGYNSPGV